MGEVQTQNAARSARPATRIDRPHQVKGEPALPVPPEVSQAQAEAGLPGGTLQSAEQVLVQASQLASHLRARQRDLDRREAMLNARTAQLEQQQRSGRLWFEERKKELDERAAELERRSDELDRRAAALAAAEAADRDQSPDAVPPTSNPSPIEQARIASEDSLEGPEAELHQQLALLADQREQLCQWRRQLEQRACQQQEQLACQRREAEAELARRTEQLERRASSLAAREAALVQMRSDVMRLYQQSVEMRLVAQQLWTRLCQRAAPAQLTKAMAQVRGTLDRCYETAKQQLAEQRQQLQQLAARLEQRKDQLHEQREAIEQWARRRQEQIEEQAARLVAREQELDAQQEHYQRLQQQWDRERRRYQRRIRQLLALDNQTKFVSAPEQNV